MAIHSVLTLAATSGTTLRPIIIGVDGPSGSGKSTLARRLAESAMATVIQVDDFVSWSDFAGWWPRFDEQVLTPLSQGKVARYQVRDWAGDEFGSSLKGWKMARATSVVIIEGVTCTRRAAADRLAYRIWVEAPAQTRLRRGIQRDGEDHRELWVSWMEEESAFFAADGTRARADLLVDGSPPLAGGDADARSADDVVLLAHSLPSE